jgi:hypothetical protein
MHTTPLRLNLLPKLCTLLALLAPLGAMAQPEKGSELTIAASVLHFGYQEFDDAGKLLDREDGFVPGVVLGLSHTVNRWQFAGDFAYHGGDVVYTGQTNTGIPINTHTRQNIADIAVRAEYWLQSSRGSNFALYLGAGYHHWDRNIQPTTTASGIPVSGLFETYTWWTGFVGAKTEIYESASSRLLLDARLLQTINPTMSVTYGQGDKVTLALGERLGFRLSLPWRHTLAHSSNLIVESYAESYELGRSAIVGGIYEPVSQTINYGLIVGISQHF